jgi:transposase InsO family protein
MKKEEIRKEFFKLRIKGFSYEKCKTILSGRYEYKVTIRTLKRWNRRLESNEWDLRDSSRRPKTIHYKVDKEIEKEVIALRAKTGWGQEKLLTRLPHLGISSTTIKRLIRKNNLTREVKQKGKRVKWVRWQRKHPNSLWQIDHTDEQDKFNCYTLSVLDDCSRYSLCLKKLDKVTTEAVISILDELINIHGKPREILTDNGPAFGLSSKKSRFDVWCRRRGIKHIRTKVHSPTTNGKVERLFKTIDEEIDFCNNDLENFRLRYNHHRPHSSLNGKCPADIYFSFWSLF